MLTVLESGARVQCVPRACLLTAGGDPQPSLAVQCDANLSPTDTSPSSLGLCASSSSLWVNSDQAGRILGRGQPGWAPVRGTGSADAQVHVGDGAGKEASDGFDGGLNIHTG